MQYKNKQEELFTKINIHKLITNIILLSLILLFIIKTFFIPRINIISPSIISLNDEYVPTYEAFNSFHDFTDQVLVENKVKPNKEGNYIVTYNLKYFFLNITEKQVVSVQYYGTPQLTLIGDQTINVCPNGKYEEPGFTAYDEQYGDVTNKVKVYRNDNTLLYVVKNRNSKEVSKTRNIIYQDIEPPELILNGDSELTLIKGSTYEEKGYNITDNCDEEIDSKVTVTGTVDTNKIGTYTLNYTVSDSSNNTTNKTRTIKIIEKPKTSNRTYNPTTGSIIYLTFDDGPSSTITPEILDILNEEQVPATFFVINHSDSLNYLLLREINEGHTLALHSYTHDYASIYSSDEDFMEDLRLIHDKVYNVTGIDSKITRFPGGSSNTISKRYNEGIMSRLTSGITNQGYTYFDWNIDSDDAGNAKTKEDIYNNVTSRLQKGRNNVVLMHDFENNNKTLNALRDIIRYGKENGYTFEKITEDTEPVRHGVNN